MLAMLEMRAIVEQGAEAFNSAMRAYPVQIGCAGHSRPELRW
jgi:hypothetical protein